MIQRVLVLMFALAPFSFGQSKESAQTRIILHPRYFLGDKSDGKGWFAVGWSISNVMSTVPDNTNLFMGFGYATKTWSLENMVQKQWSSAGGSVWLDWRFFAKPHNRIGLYLEGAPRLDRKMFYEFATLDVRLAGPLNFGVETENVHRQGRDTLGAGPRIAIPLPLLAGKLKPVVVVSRQFRTQGPNLSRIYVVLNWSF